MNPQEREKVKQREIFRTFAYLGDANSFREGALRIQQNDPGREVSVDALELNAYLIECDFPAVEGKIQAINAKYAKDDRRKFVSKFSEICLAHNQFAKGQILAAIETSYSYVNDNEIMSDIDPVDVMAMYRLLAQALWVSGRYSEIGEIQLLAKSFYAEKDSLHATYVMNCIDAIYECSRGEIYKALEIAERNISIANQNLFKGIYGPIDMKIVAAECYFQLNLRKYAENFLSESIQWASSMGHQSWKIFARIFDIDFRTFSKNFKEGLTILRETRGDILLLHYRNDLGTLADRAEFRLRKTLGDFDRASSLLLRLEKTDLWSIFELRLASAQGEDISELLAILPEITPKVTLEKRILSAVQFLDKRKICLEYLQQALSISEETGMRAIFFSHEELARRVIEGVNLKHTLFFETLVSELTYYISAEKTLNSGQAYEPLTQRELQVLRSMATGDKIQDIAFSLHLSVNTVKTHSRHIYRKLGASGKSEAVRIARENLLI